MESKKRYNSSFSLIGGEMKILREQRLTFESEKEMWAYYDSIEDKDRVTYINRDMFCLDLDAVRLTVEEYREEISREKEEE